MRQHVGVGVVARQVWNDLDPLETVAVDGKPRHCLFIQVELDRYAFKFTVALAVFPEAFQIVFAEFHDFCQLSHGLFEVT